MKIRAAMIITIMGGTLCLAPQLVLSYSPGPTGNETYNQGWPHPPVSDTSSPKRREKPQKQKKCEKKQEKQWFKWWS